MIIDLKLAPPFDDVNNPLQVVCKHCVCYIYWFILGQKISVLTTAYNFVFSDRYNHSFTRKSLFLQSFGV